MSKRSKSSANIAEEPSSLTEVRNALSEKPRILALDVGAKRIGLAISDPLGITAQGLETLHRRDRLRDLNDLAGVIRKYGVAEIVVGHPLGLDGTESVQTEKVLKFLGQVKARFDLPVHLWEERLTSVEAENFLKESKVAYDRGSGLVDRLAAQFILRSYLEHRFHLH